MADNNNNSNIYELKYKNTDGTNPVDVPLYAKKAEEFANLSSATSTTLSSTEDNNNTVLVWDNTEKVFKTKYLSNISTSLNNLSSSITSNSNTINNRIDKIVDDIKGNNTISCNYSSNVLTLTIGTFSITDKGSSK